MLVERRVCVKNYEPAALLVILSGFWLCCSRLGNGISESGEF